ncbi:MAG: hypothetical protein M3Y57_10425 [Acidobacteriota bacterium]|nr:hypothetical protein [Acidobacteriota bacterium]
MAANEIRESLLQLQPSGPDQPGLAHGRIGLDGIEKETESCCITHHVATGL